VHNLTEDQVDLLVHILIEECGSELTDDQIAENAAMLLEDVAGFDSAPDDVISCVINQIRSAYHVTTNR